MKVHIIAKSERQSRLALTTLKEFKAEVRDASPEMRNELFKLLASNSDSLADDGRQGSTERLKAQSYAHHTRVNA